MNLQHPIATFLRDHLVAGEPVLPGAVAAELLLAAAQQTLGHLPKGLRQVTFLRPIRPGWNGCMVTRIEIDGHSEQGRMRLLAAERSSPPGELEEWSEHVTAQILAGTKGRVAAYDVPALRQRCPHTISTAALYRFFADAGLQYGPTLRTINSVACNECEVVADLKLTPDMAAAPGVYLLHPSLLDGAFQSLGALALRAGVTDVPLYVPYAIDELVVHGVLPSQVLCFGKSLAPAGELPDILRAELTLTDLQGAVLVELLGVSAKRVPSGFLTTKRKEPSLSSGLREKSKTWPQQPKTPSPREEKPSLSTELLQEVVWELQPLSGPAGSFPSKACYWIFTDEGGLGSALSRRLTSHGLQVIQIRRGSAFSQAGPDSFVLNPRHLDEYQNLVRTLYAVSPPTAILHLWSCDALAATSVELLDSGIELGVFSVFQLAQSLLSVGLRSFLELVVVTTGSHPVETDQDCCSPESAAAWGLARTLALESSNIALRCIDLEPSVYDYEATSELILDELSAGQAAPEVAYRRGQRWLPQFRRLDRLQAGMLPLKRHGVYLITGGLGGIGMELAGWLLEKWQARLVLVSRNPVSARAQILMAKGGEVVIERTNVADLDAMREVVSRTRQRFGRISGIFHAAGIKQDRLLRDKDPQSFRDVLQPKINGAWVLDRVTRDDHVDLMVFFSSIVSFSGNVGQSDYAAANRYLDCFSAWRNAQGRPTWSISWGPWSETGMTVGMTKHIRAFGLNPMSSQDALAALEQALRGPPGRVGIVKYDSPALPAAPALPPMSRETPEVEELLIRELATFLLIDVEHIDPETNFFEYGIDSIMAVRLLRQLADHTGITLSPTVMFEAPTVRALARVLVEKHRPQLSQLSMRGDTARVPKPTAPSPLSVPREPSVAQLPEQAFASASPKEVASEGVAVIGYAGRFPGAPNPEAYWDLLCRGAEAVTEVPPGRWRSTDYFDSDPTAPGKTYSKWGGFLDDLELFDPLFFGSSLAEARTMDPQQRLLLEVAWEALERAGYSGRRIEGSKTAVFIGAGTSEYVQRFLGGSQAHAAQIGIGNLASMLSNRLSHYLNLKGPSLTLDTACSSSLVALHLAAESLRRGECEQALVGSVNLLLSPSLFIAFSKAHMLSRSGRCRPFDVHADGFVRSEGAAVVLLKPLSAALRDGDQIHGVIRGTAVNQAGRTGILSAPSVSAQAELLRQACQTAGISPRTISYFETHAVGHPLADLAELQALDEVLSADSVPLQSCGLGSLKSAIGHPEVAAGMAALVKVLLALAHRQLPPLAAMVAPNPQLLLEQTPFFIVDRLQPWTAFGPLRAGINALGFGGTNAHTIIEEAPSRPPVRNEPDRPLHLLTLSARSDHALPRLAASLSDYINSHPGVDLGNLCHTLNTGRAVFSHRLAVYGSTAEEVRQELDACATGRPQQKGASGIVAGSRHPKVAFLFTGQGSQYVNMGRELFRAHPGFAKTLRICDELARAELQYSLLEVIYGEQTDKGLLDQTLYTQPALFALGYGLAQLWRSWGVEPAAVLGHSVGELVAAAVAGVMSLEDGMRLTLARGRLLQSLAEGGAMAAVLAEEGQVREMIAALGQQVAIAAINGPAHTVISGPRSAIEALLRQCEKAAIGARWLNVSHAFHSPLVDPIIPAFEKVARNFSYQPPTSPLVSNVSGRMIDPRDGFDAGYWVRHLRAPVRFADGMAALVAAGCDIFLELGPDPVLIGMGRRVQERSGALWLPSLQRGKGDWEALLGSAANLYTRGINLDGVGLDHGYQRRKMVLPTYPFERQRCWVEQEPTTQPVSTVLRTQPPLSRTRDNLQREQIEPLLRAEVARVLGVPAQQIDPERPLVEVGLNSVMAIDLASRLEGRFKFRPTLFETAENVSLRDLVRWVEQHLDTSLPPRTAEEPDGLGQQAGEDLLSAREWYGRYARPATAERLGALRMDKLYVSATGDRMVFAENGETRTVIDLLGGFGSTLFGHHHPELVSCLGDCLARRIPIHAQASIRGHVGTLARSLSARLQSLTGSAFVATLTNSGAETIEAALKHADMEYCARFDEENLRIKRSFALLAHDRRRRPNKALPAQLLSQLEHLCPGKTPRNLREVYQLLLGLNKRVRDRTPSFIVIGASFHGKTSGAASLTANPDYHAPYSPLADRVCRVGAGESGALSDLVEQQLDLLYELVVADTGSLALSAWPWCCVAALFVEPVQGEGGIRPLPMAFLATARKLADAHRFPIVLDEVQTGLGRCGAFSAASLLGLHGDYYALGKSLGGGQAKIGVLLVRQDRYQPGFGLYQVSTFAEDEIGAVLALKALELFDRDDLAAVCGRKGGWLMARLAELRERYPGTIAEVRGMGLMIGVELADPAGSCSAALRLAGSQLGHLAAGYLLNEEGVRLMPTTSSSLTLRIEPSAYIGEAEMEHCVRALDRLCRILYFADAGRLLRYLTTTQTGSCADAERDPPSDWRARHPLNELVVPTGEPQVAFLTYFINPEDMSRWDPSLAALPPDSCAALIARLQRVAPPQVFRTVRVLASDGAAVHLSMVGFLLSSASIEQLMRSGETAWLHRRLDQAVESARAAGCSLVGFGGLLSVLSHNCRKNATPDIGLTTGNALTVAAGVEAIRQACAARGIDFSAARVAVVGAAGNICRTYAQIIAKEVPQLLLVGRAGSQAGLRQLAESLYEAAWSYIQDRPATEHAGLALAIRDTSALRTVDPGKGSIGRQLQHALDQELGESAPVRIADSLSCLNQCNVILTASNAASPIIFPEHLAPGPLIICDIAVPPDVDSSVLRERNDVLVLTGGAIKLPAQPQLELCPGFLPPGHVFACMAETVLLGLAGVRDHYSFGAIDQAQVEQILALAQRHGFIADLVERRAES